MIMMMNCKEGGGGVDDCRKSHLNSSERRHEFFKGTPIPDQILTSIEYKSENDTKEEKLPDLARQKMKANID